MANIIALPRVPALLALLAALAAIVVVTTSTASANQPAQVIVYADGALYNAIIPMSPHGTVQYPHVPDGAVPSVADLETTDDLYIVVTNSVTPLVSDSAPGDSDYNGGRWLPRMVTPLVDPGLIPELTSEEAIIAATVAGKVSISAAGDVFLCPITSAVNG